MSNPLLAGLRRFEHALDRGKVALKTRLGLWGRPKVQVFRGHGSPSILRVTGRIVEETGTREAGVDVSRLRTMLNTFRRMESDELPGVRLRVRACGLETEAVTDEEGFFAVELECADAQPGWHQVDVDVVDSPSRHEGVSGSGEVLVIADDCELGYVSDLDDTVIATGARNKVTHTRLLLVRDALEHEAFPGVAALYTQLTRGPDGHSPRPVFYVSRSSWGLYDLMIDFMRTHDVPRGPTFLMDVAVVEEKSTAVGHEHHKIATIAEILDAHPRLSVVLIGDSGQQDPETYLEAVQRWPDRIRAVWLRDVTSEERDAEVKRIVTRIEELGVPAAACRTSSDMAREAERLGFIPAGSAESIGR